MGLVVSQREKNGEMIEVWGTGSLIGPNHVLTCGHNCFYAEQKQDHKNIEFIPSQIVREVKGDKYSGVGFKVKEVLLPDQYRKMNKNIDIEVNQGYLFDYAVLVLDTN